FSSRRRHTRCYRDWSSDVCSSDLPRDVHAAQTGCAFGKNLPQVVAALSASAPARLRRLDGATFWGPMPRRLSGGAFGRVDQALEIGRASCRERAERWGVTGAWREK